MIDFWVLALLAPMSWAGSNLVDNHVLSSRLRDPIVYDIVSILMSSAFAIMILFAVKISFDFNAYFVGTAVGFAFAFLFVLYNIGMMNEEGTSVISIIYTLPLYVAILSRVFLGETLSPSGYAGIVLLTASAVLVSYRKLGRGRTALALVLVFAIGSATTRVVSKSALNSVDVWSYLFWFTVGQVLGAAALSSIPRYRKRVLDSVRIVSARTLSLIAASTVFGFTGYYLFYSALSVGPVAVASGITAIQPTIVLLFSTAVSSFSPGSLPVDAVKGHWSIHRKIAAVFLILLGTWALA